MALTQYTYLVPAATPVSVYEVAPLPVSDTRTLSFSSVPAPRWAAWLFWKRGTPVQMTPLF